MSKIPLNKLKNSAMNFASTALLRVELAAEESRLKNRFQALGQKLHGAVRDDLLSAIKDDPSVVEILGAIEEHKRKINSLRERIDGEKT
ncbi:hypothetical protein SAMN05720766_11624 [Fibrobacter sp. UWH9]|uniref:hypothetical protein n=2 Tax=unclassified Fibrobacter TaxID=2634177 RepID=UPI00091B4A40|nr:MULTISPECIES: hypothetical protein [unclassified Fibrobacter]MCL4102840.1 hypothetical protein [Fibrobacter succinogenes]SHH60556.1 hypothetical protein SAMN05720766_11624 [Fibrobacter sp. UWH9]SHL63794.1 hypothetical protein SAMN05720764_11925 [Fibrobacter sp. UWH5]SHL70821.1 hypothetical protein SAMN05720765_12216 [Fibrobacter sp. UWH6]